MKLVWGSFFWYMTCAFVLVSSTARFILLENATNTTSLIGYVTISASTIVALVYFMVLLKYRKHNDLKNHVYFVVFVFVNIFSLGIIQVAVGGDLFEKMFPTLFSFQLILVVLSFLSEVSFRDLGKEIFNKEMEDNDENEQ